MRYLNDGVAEQYVECQDCQKNKLFQSDQDHISATRATGATWVNKATRANDV